MADLPSIPPQHRHIGLDVIWDARGFTTKLFFLFNQQDVRHFVESLVSQPHEENQLDRRHVDSDCARNICQ